MQCNCFIFQKINKILLKKLILFSKSSKHQSKHIRCFELLWHAGRAQERCYWFDLHIFLDFAKLQTAIKHISCFKLLWHAGRAQVRMILIRISYFSWFCSIEVNFKFLGKNKERWKNRKWFAFFSAKMRRFSWM